MSHPYIPNTDPDRAEMLKTIGVGSIDELFCDVPASVKYPALNLPAALSEVELMREIQALAGRNADLTANPCFLGAGAYNHFVPSIVSHLIFRSEYYTAYTPYQAEISQGTLQTIFEYQSMICALTGMEVANASHYDGATATAEAAILAVNQLHGRDKVLVCPTLHPEYRATLRTYLEGQGIQVAGDEDSATTFEQMVDAHLDDRTACVIVANPDFLGRVRDLKPYADRVHAAGALFIVSAYPISLGLYKAPGEYGADVVVGEGQSLGNIAFGPDGYLYIGMGDGGSGGDPGNRAQSVSTLLGKMLRIDINGTSGTKQYRIPSTNPYVGKTGLDEIWQRGLRNPWRWSFDKATGNLWIGDVGQNRYEEVDRAVKTTTGAGRGYNWGWHVMEGFHCYLPASGCSTSGKRLPLLEYSHSTNGRCAITGGYVYRGTAIASLRGWYVFGDYCSGEVLAVPNTATSKPTPVTLFGTGSGRMVSAFGQDTAGELYVVDLGGTVYRIDPA
jgi:hypothetical protein